MLRFERPSLSARVIIRDCVKREIIQRNRTLARLRLLGAHADDPFLASKSFRRTCFDSTRALTRLAEVAQRHTCPIPDRLRPLRTTCSCSSRSRPADRLASGILLEHLHVVLKSPPSLSASTPGGGHRRPRCSTVRLPARPSSRRLAAKALRPITREEIAEQAKRRQRLFDDLQPFAVEIDRSSRVGEAFFASTIPSTGPAKQLDRMSVSVGCLQGRRG